MSCKRKQTCCSDWIYYATYKNPKNETRRVVFTHLFKSKTYCVYKVIDDAPFIATIKYVYGSQDVATIISHWLTNQPIDRVPGDVERARELIDYFNRIG